MKEVIEENILREIGRINTLGYYQHQDVRKGMMNGIRDVIRKKNEGIKFDEVEEEKETDKKYKDSGKYSDSKLGTLLVEMKDQKIVNLKEYEYILSSLQVIGESSKYENTYKKLMHQYIDSEAIYVGFLSKIKGMGDVLSANLIRVLGYCERYKHVSSVWKHFGLAPVHQCRECGEQFDTHMDKCPKCNEGVVVGMASKRMKGQKITWSPELRTLAWKIGDSMFKQRTPFYRTKIFDNELERQMAIMNNTKCSECGKKWDDKTHKSGKKKHRFVPENPKSATNKKHCMNRAQRKMVKIFLEHYYIFARRCIGLETSQPYAIEKLQHETYMTVDEAIEINVE